MKYEIPLLLQHAGGAIVNTSPAGIKVFGRGAAYAAAKHGVVGLTMMDRFTGGIPEGRERAIAQERIGRMGRPEEIAAAVVWPCSVPADTSGGSNHALPVRSAPSGDHWTYAAARASRTAARPSRPPSARHSWERAAARRATSRGP